MSMSDRLDQIERETVEANEQWDCGRSAFNADNHAPPIDVALVNGERTLAALRAVLDLHKPRGEEVLAPECSTEECDCEDRCRLVVIEVCGHCCELGVSAHAYAYEEGGIETVTWPCPTVRAVEAALGEEARNGQ